jgi:hypothetical protein
MTYIESQELVEVVRASLLRHIISELKELRDLRDYNTPISAIVDSIGSLTVALLNYEDVEKNAKKAAKEAKREQGREVAAAIFESSRG